MVYAKHLGTDNIAKRLGRGVAAVRQLHTQKIGSEQMGALLCGDSITNANMSESAVTAHKENNGIITTLNARMKQRLKLIAYFDQGVGGEDAQDRVLTLSDYDTVLARHPEIKVAFEAYGRNDLSAGRTVAEVVADRKTINNHLLGLVEIVFVESIKPSDYGSNTVAYNGRAEEINAELREWCFNHPNLFFVDTYSKLGDTSGFDAGNSYDDIHLAGQGAWRGSDAYMEVVPFVIGMGRSFGPDENSLLTNADLSGTGGSISSPGTGDVSANWELVSFGTAGGAGLTLTASKTPEGHQRIVQSTTALATADQYTYFKEDITSGFEAGQVYRAKAEIKINSGDKVFWAGLEINQRDGGSTIFTSSDLHRRDRDALIDVDGMAGKTITLQTMDFVVLEPCDEIEFRVAFAVVSLGQVTELDVEVVKCSLEEVDLNVREYLGTDLEFYLNPDDENTFGYDPDTMVVNRIMDSSYNDNHATIPSGYSGAIYQPEGLDGLPALFNNTDDSVGYEFDNSLLVTDPRMVLAVGKGDTSDSDSGSASNALFSANNDSDSGDAIGTIRQVRDNHSQHQLTMYGYGSSYSDVTDEAHVYWGRWDGTDVDGGYDKTVTEGPTAGSAGSRVQTPQSYIFTDTGSVSRSYSGWGRHMMLVKGVVSETQRLALVYFATKQNQIAL